jgi:hypothetical protein
MFRYANVRINILTNFREEGGKLLASGTTDANGLFSRIHPFRPGTPAWLLQPDYLGLPSEVEVPVANGKINFTLGGSQQPGLKAAPFLSNQQAQYFIRWGRTTLREFLFTWNPFNDVIDTQFLNDINASFPERQPVPIHNPHYLDPGQRIRF